MDARTWAVAELAADLGRLVAQAFPGEIWVKGQIRDLKRAPSGHVFFQLAEPGPADRQPTASVAVALFQTEREAVNGALKRAGGAVRMVDGIEVRIRGRVQVFAPRGQLQLRMVAIDPAWTLGRLAEDRERVLALLRADGVLGANQALPLPLVPLTVGLVTSAGSAAHADFVHELEASGIAFRVLLADARTQGADAERSVPAALAALAGAGAQVLALVRGGGARSDLAAFDGEAIARAIATSPVPVLTGIGHEIDTTVADAVAHRAAKTPTACAALLVEHVRGYLGRTEELWAAISRAGLAHLGGGDDRLRTTAHRLARATRAGLAVREAAEAGARRRLRREVDVALRRADDRLTRDVGRVEGAARGHLRSHAADLDVAARRVGALAPRRLDEEVTRLRTAEARARALDPARALARGWAIVRDGEGTLVRSPGQAPVGSALTITVADGDLHAVAADAPPAPHQPGDDA